MAMTDIDKLEMFLNRLCLNDDIKISSLTHFRSLDYVYLWTNESLKDYYQTNVEGKSVLTVTSSGDHALHATLAGAKEIHCFDVNEFSKIVASLKVNLIRNLDYNDFFKYMSLLGENKINAVLDKVSNYLTNDDLLFWKEYEKIYNDTNNCLFISGNNYIPSNNAYFDEEKYYETKDKLGKCKIVYHDALVEDLSSILYDYKFDAIYLSNILGRIEKRYSDVDDVAVSLIHNLDELLNVGGRIYDYSLRVANHKCYYDDDLKISFDISSKIVGDKKDVVYVYLKK